jgi:hypothetical protein
MKAINIEKVSTDLELKEYPELHRRGWRIQRWGFVFIFAMIAFGAMGFFGDGFFSKGHYSNSRLSIEYEKFFRFHALMPLRVKVNNSSSGVSISFPQKYWQQMKLEEVVPIAKENLASGDRMEYYFQGNGPMLIVFYLEPQDVGTVKGAIVVNGEEFPISHFIYP